MKYIAAYALLTLGGKKDITAADIEKVLKEGGIKADADRSAKLVEALKGKAFHELVEAGIKKMGSASAAPAGGAASSGAGAQKAKVVEEEKPKEEEADVDMGGLFGAEEY